MMTGAFYDVCIGEYCGPMYSFSISMASGADAVIWLLICRRISSAKK